jgi:cation diffusion facilitator family transporter
MLAKALDWLGFSSHLSQGHGHGQHDHDRGSHHGHTHGIIDPTIATTARGIWAIKWSFVILGITAVLQMVVVAVSGSVALLADTIHNVGDATTAIPLWIAFLLARRKPTATFTYGYGRVEDFAGIVIVLIILFSAIVAGYESIDRLIHPQPIANLGWVTLAGIVGFLGNEAVAVFRIRVGREMNSAALIADGYHARVDGLTSLAVVLGAAGVWLGFPLADPIVGLIITVAIFGIVWQSARAVLTRMLDGVEPGVLAEIRHAAEHVPGLKQIHNIKARWLGHRLHVDVTIIVDAGASLAEATAIADAFRRELSAHMPALAAANVVFATGTAAGTQDAHGPHRHHHAPEPFKVSCGLAEGLLEIVDTPAGERMRLTLSRPAPGLLATVNIKRPGGMERLLLSPAAATDSIYESAVAPAEPHELEADLSLTDGTTRMVLPFRMVEPPGHHR